MKNQETPRQKKINTVIQHEIAYLIQGAIRKSSTPNLMVSITKVKVVPDISKAKDILINAKMRRPGICGAAETLLIDKKTSPIALLSVALIIIWTSPLTLIPAGGLTIAPLGGVMSIWVPLSTYTLIGGMIVLLLLLSRTFA